MFLTSLKLLPKSVGCEMDDLWNFNQYIFICPTESVRSYYNLIVRKASQFLSGLQVSLLKLALSLRAYSPAVHAFQQVRPHHIPTASL